MSTHHQESWNLLNPFPNELNHLFEPHYLRHSKKESNACDWVPAVDIKEEADRFLIQADIPGVDPKGIDIHMDNGVLTVSGNRLGDHTKEQTGYRHQERASGSFIRRFTLPDTANVEKISAKGIHGVLEVSIPKQEQVKPKKITVEA